MRRQIRSITTRGVALALVAAAAAGGAGSAAPQQDMDAIWRLEQSLYGGASGAENLARYLDSMDRDYAGWPPQSAVPLDHSHMAAAAAAARGGKPVELAMTRQLVRVHRDGDVALAFYTTHRTLRAGKPVDETFETLHVWIRKDGAWKLFGAMVRPAANRG